MKNQPSHFLILFCGALWAWPWLAVIAEEMKPGAEKGQAPVSAQTQATEENARKRQQIELLVGRLGDPEFAVREQAIKDLLEAGEWAQDLLAQAADHQDPEIRWRVRKILVCLKWKVMPDFHERLAGVMDDYEEKDWQDRQRICQEIGIVGKEKAIPTLLEILKRDSSPSVQRTAVATLYQLGEAGIAVLIEQGVKLEGLEPYQVDIFISLGNRYLSEQKFEKAEREYQKALKADPGNSVAAYNMACVYSLKKDLDKALIWLERSVEYGFDDFKWMREDPDLNNLHGHPKYQEILKKRRRPRIEDEDNEAE